MINEGASVLKGKYKAGIDWNPELQQINFLDRRVYRRADDLFYPSVTSILSFLPKDRFFENWIKDVGHNADIILQRAGKEGTQVHEAVEALVKGEELKWIDDYGNARYGELVWGMILKFADFWKTYKPELISSEDFVYSDEFKYAGTTDLVIRLDGKIWLLDVKTSNNLHKSHELQVAAYKIALKECKGVEIDKVGILWLKAYTHKPSKILGVYQGNGWQIKEVENIDSNFEMFRNIYKIYEMSNPITEPIYNSYPTTIKL